MSIREQGGTLDLHTSTGLKALREAGLYEEYAQYARYDGEALNLADKNLVSMTRVGCSTEGFQSGKARDRSGEAASDIGELVA